MIEVTSCSIRCLFTCLNIFMYSLPLVHNHLSTSGYYSLLFYCCLFIFSSLFSLFCSLRLRSTRLRDEVCYCKAIVILDLILATTEDVHIETPFYFICSLNYSSLLDVVLFFSYLFVTTFVYFCSHESARTEQ